MMMNKIPDGVRTNAVATDVPPFPLMNFRGKMWAKCGNTCALKANYGRM